MEWPKEAAKQTKLFVPRNYDPYQTEDAQRHCYLKFDDVRKALVLVAEDTEEVLDIIDPEDMIGASVEVELVGSPSEEPRATFQNRSDENAPSSPAYGGVFRPVGENKDKIFTIVNSNEPKSAIPFDTQAIATLTIYVYPRTDPSKESIVTSCTGSGKTKPVKSYPQTDNESSSKLLHRYNHHRRFQVAPAEDFTHVSALVTAIRGIARPTSGTTERLLVVINPFSGRKKSVEVYNTIVVPMLEQAGIDHDHVVTNCAGHGEEQMAKRSHAGDDGIDDIVEYDGLIAIGGDGSVYEIMQGIKKRPDCDQVLKRLKLGHIGAGTSNGLAATLAHASQEHNTPTDYAFIVAKGKTVAMDLSRYETKSTDYLSFLTFSWSIIADIDIESEVLRWMGWLRMDVYGVWRVLNLRSYRAKLSYVPPSTKRLESLPPLTEPLPKDQGWITIEDGFCLFWASQVARPGEAMLTHPQSKHDDGLFHICIVRDTVSRLRMALILLGLESGGHVDMDAVEFIECSAYRLEPITVGSFNDLDGEVIEPGPIQGMVLPGAIKAYCNL